MHLIYLSFKIARERVESNAFTDPKVKALLDIGIKIFGLKQLSLDARPLYEAGYFGKGSAGLLSAAYDTVLSELRPQMVPFVECFPKANEFLPTTIGNKYGDIYE